MTPMATVEAATSGQPKLRGDLLVSPQGDAFVVKDPRSRRFFRFGALEHFILRQLDGSAPAEVIRQRAEAQLEAALAPGTVEAFVERLRRIGLLETGGRDSPLSGGKPGPWRGSLLYLRLKAFDPDRLLDRLIGKVRFFFTPSFLTLSATVILVALATTVASREEIGRDLLRLYRVEMLLPAWLTIFAVTAAHEFAHSLTCKRFGGRVHEMGFLLIYFQLAFYCNVSDAWLFPKKSHRLWVTFAGPYFELFLWALATLTWRVTEPGTALSSVALIVMATSGFKLFINLNPLIKLDGYYLLSDALGIPNLRAKAFGYLGAAIRRLWGAPGAGTPDATPRERRIYLAYGLLAGTYSFWLLGYVALLFGSFLVERYQGAGFVLYTGLLLTMFRNPLKKALPTPPSFLRAWREQIASMKRPLTVLMSLGLVLAVLFLARLDLRVSGEFTVLPAHDTDVRAEVEGIIEAVYVKEGDRVRQGDRIARLSERDARAELRKVEAELEEKRARLRMLKAGPRPQEIELARKALETARTRREHAGRRSDEAERMHASRLARARNDLAKAEERLRYAQNDLERFRKLFRDELISRSQLDETEERAAMREKEAQAARAELQLVLADDWAEVRQELAVASGEMAEAEAKLALVHAGSRPEEIAAGEAEVTRLEAQRRYLETQLELARVVSPISGVVTTPKPKEKVGQYVKKGDLIAEVHELNTVRVEIAVSEKDIGDVRVGQPVFVKARAFPEASFSGVVTEVAPAAAREEHEAWRGKIVRVTTEIDNPTGVLKPEMTGNAKISCGERRLVELLTRRLARYVRVEFWSWW